MSVATDRPPLAEMLREVAKTLDKLGVLALHLADVAERDALEAEDPVLTVGEVAAELRCSESVIRSACASGALQAFQAAGWKIRRSKLRAYERRRTGIRRVA